MTDFFDDPEPNMFGSFECGYCAHRNQSARYDYQQDVLAFSCTECNKQTTLKDFLGV